MASGMLSDEAVIAPLFARQGVHRPRGGGIVLDDRNAGGAGGGRVHGISMAGNA
jgi:hypothetical protein